MKKELYRFIEGIPAKAGYANYERFQKGAIVYLDEDFPFRYCILCNEEGKSIVDEEDEEVFLEWHVSFDESPIWEDKLEFYKEVETDDTDIIHCKVNLYPEKMSVEALMSVLKTLPSDSTIHLDSDGSFTSQCLEENTKVVVLLESEYSKLIALPTPRKEVKVPDINDLFNSLDGTECLTINFHNND